jgi:hypothetical protein
MRHANRNGETLVTSELDSHSKPVYRQRWYLLSYGIVDCCFQASGNLQYTTAVLNQSELVSLTQLGRMGERQPLDDVDGSTVNPDAEYKIYNLCLM